MEATAQGGSKQTLSLIEFLMKNGSIEFVAVVAEKFKVYIEPFAYYEFSKDYEDLGFGSELTSSRDV